MTKRAASNGLAGLLVAAAVACGSQHPNPVHGGLALPFIENDFAQAQSRARDAGLPLFVEVWAPW